jgi:NDP-sugar pyrophosphorylase family protein
MDSVSILPGGSIGKGFVPAEYLPQGKDEYYIRNEQNPGPLDRWRHLRADEVERLTKNGNASDKWDDVLVADDFDTQLVKNSVFCGLVRIGRIRNIVLEHHGLRLPTGITNSRIISCDIGDDCAIHEVHHLAHYIIGDRCILMNIDEMLATDCARFGNGIFKDGQEESQRIWLDIMNEAGCRRVLPFDGMIPADAYIWAKYRDDKALQEKLKDITQKTFDSRRGCYGYVGPQSVIKASRIIKDVKIGPHCRIEGASRLKNLTINSSPDEQTLIGEGVGLADGIIGYGCHILSGAKAARFVLGDNSSLKYGARLIDSFVGDNSTISCCEVLNNLTFPAHEQHHNNSFLIASLVMGQSNVAAGATIGSNHNSRAADGEVQAGRGFWPGLCVSVIHPSRFASFVLLAKGDYSSELDIPMPFSLLSNDATKDRLNVVPAFWWLYNMYALARNASKFVQRDKRTRRAQHIEFESLAPDTVEEIFVARRLLEIWTAKASLRKKGTLLDKMKDDDLAVMGRQLLSSKDSLNGFDVIGENMERSGRKVAIFKPYESYRAYGEMLHYYAIKTLAGYSGSFSNMCDVFNDGAQKDWVNLGGQLVPVRDIDALRADIAAGKLSTWKYIHARYDSLWHGYPLEKQRHAYMTLCRLLNTDRLTKEQWLSALDRAAVIQEYVCNQVYISRKKDFDNPFRKATYRNVEEMTATAGTIEDNSFVKQVRKETDDFKKTLEDVKKKV